MRARGVACSLVLPPRCSVFSRSRPVEIEIHRHGGGRERSEVRERTGWTDGRMRRMEIRPLVVAKYVWGCSYTL